MLGKTHVAIQIERWVVKEMTSLVVLPAATWNAKRTPFVIRPPSTMKNNMKKPKPYDFLGTRFIGPHFKNRHMPKEAEQILKLGSSVYVSSMVFSMAKQSATS
jgi:hypothetical protein